MRTAQDVIGFFERNRGLVEKPDGTNINWITDWFGMHDAWCAMACSRALVEAGFTTDGDTLDLPGLALTTVKGWARVSVVAKAFSDAGLYGQEPRPGSLGILVYPLSGDWVDFNGFPGDHVCVVAFEADDGTVVTWDGNISNRLDQNRWPRSWFHGFCYPPYDGEAAAPVDAWAGLFEAVLA
ncbi:MAG: hypothetical protein ABR540_00155 [Acidimicrobiales bacterium]|nr:hypothetical protein [Actinomycetota bacterium]